MLGEYFIDRCIELCCSEQEDINRTFFDNINYIIKWYIKEIKENDIAIEFMTKIELTKYLSEYRILNKKFKFNKMINNLHNGKAKKFVDVLKLHKDKEFTEEDFEELNILILSKKKLCNRLTGKSKLQVLLDDMETGNFIDDDEVSDRWDHLISRAWSQLNEIRRVESIGKVATLDLLNDNYDSVMESIRESYNRKNTISTGYKSVDRLFPAGGFEQSRLYIIGGTSGVGKSNFLVNLPCNAIDNVENNRIIKSGEEDIYLYVTGENLIRESLERYYCCLTKTPHVKMVKRVLEDKEFSLRDEIVNHLSHKKSTIVMKYIKPNSSSTEDLRIMIDDLAQTGRLKAVYFDYLDLIRSRLMLPDLRLDLGQVCIDFKDFAVEYKLPFITATQLNKSGYDQECIPTLTSVSESMKKVDNSDFVLFLQPAKDSQFQMPYSGGTRDCIKMKMTVLKNRNGETGDSTYVMTVKRFNNMKAFNYKIYELPKQSDDNGLVIPDYNASTECTITNGDDWCNRY